jgi:hypothetical protein
MATFDQNGQEVKAGPVLEELEEINVTAVRPQDWSALLFALAGAIVYVVVEEATRRGRRR